MQDQVLAVALGDCKRRVRVGMWERGVGRAQSAGGRGTPP
jgi:hypothetical protein